MTSEAEVIRFCEVRNTLMLQAETNKEKEYRKGYVDGVLDFFNEVNKKKAEVVSCPSV